MKSPDADVVLEFERDSAGDIAEHVLQCEADHRRRNRRGREYSGDVDAETVEEIEDDQDVAGDHDHLGREPRYARFLHREIERSARDHLHGRQSDQGNGYLLSDKRDRGPSV